MTLREELHQTLDHISDSQLEFVRKTLERAQAKEQRLKALEHLQKVAAEYSEADWAAFEQATARNTWRAKE